MSDNEQVKRIPKKIAKRLTAVLIIASLMFSSVAAVAQGSRTTLEYNPDRDIENTAANFLALTVGQQGMLDYVMTAFPQNTLTGLYNTVCNQIARGDYVKALDNINKCIDLYAGEGDGILVDLLVKKACLYTILREYNKAVAVLDEALEIDPGNTEVFLIKAQIYFETAQYNRMCASLEKYLTLVPDDTGITQLLESMRRELEQIRISSAATEARLLEILNKAQACADSGDYEGFLKYCEKYLSEIPEDTSIRLLVAQVRFAIGDYEEVITHCEYIVKLEENSEADFLLGSAYIQLSDFTAAESSLTRVLAGPDPEDFHGIYYYRGVCRLALEDYEGAVEDFAESILLEQMVQSSYFNRGISYMMIEQGELGIYDIITASEMDDDEDIKQHAKLLLDQIFDALEEEI